MELPAHKMASNSPEVENWDDGDFDNFEDLHFRTASTATSVVSHPQANHRDSISSRLSMRSDSNQGDEHWDVLVDEQASVKDALTIAKSKGIPLPTNLPRSALEGGTIRRLGGKVVKKAIADDWSEDLDFANAPSQLHLAKPEERDISESLRQISAAFHAGPKSPEEKSYLETVKSPKSRPAITPVSLDNFRDVDEDDDFGDVPTIRVAKHRSPQKFQLSSPPAAKTQTAFDDMEDGLEIPFDGNLRLSTKKLGPRTPTNGDDFDMEWAEGSLGTRHAGTRRGGMSNRSSSISAMSPSVSSTFTADNEDDVVDGLVLPQGPVNFRDMLKRKQEAEKENRVPQSFSSPPPNRRQQQARPPSQPEDDWGDDLVIPNGKVFDNARLTLNRNIKYKSQRSTSPNKIKTTSLNFTTSKSAVPMPRPRYDRQERPRSHLEPVSETGAPIQRYQRPTSRLGHTANSSVSSIPAPATPTPSTPSRRDLRNSGSRVDVRYQPTTTTNAQLLRAKRSLPAIGSMSSPTRSSFNRPPSRQDGTGSRLRPRSPERPESRLGTDKKAAAPFLPAGASTAQSQHVSIKSGTTRNSRRTDSDGSGETMTAAQRSLSRIAAMRPSSPGKGRADYSPAELAAQAKKTMNKPLRRRNWGDGSELEIFDDLPTSAAAEAKYTKTPIARGAPKALRSKIGQHGQAAASSTSLVSARSGAETPVPTTPLSPPKHQELPVHQSHVPRFARDTAASRIAREQRSISTTFHNMRGEPLQPVATNAKATVIPKPTYGSSLRRKKSVQQKPHLIKPMGGDYQRPKEEKGMYYNPVLCRWEGNDTALAPFDVPDFLPQEPSPSEVRHPNIKVGSSIPVNSPTQPTGKPNMALIMNVGGTTGVQLVNGMVFDPRQMKWLKVAPGERGESIRSGTGSVQLDEEEDVFAGLSDLKEESENMSSVHDAPRDRSVSSALDKSDPFIIGEVEKPAEEEEATHASGQSGDEWGVAEEFDVGPDFVRRQRSEEDRWKRKVEKWLRTEDEVVAEETEGPGDWRWAIRELVSATGEMMGMEGTAAL